MCDCENDKKNTKKKSSVKYVCSSSPTSVVGSFRQYLHPTFTNNIVTIVATVFQCASHILSDDYGEKSFVSLFFVFFFIFLIFFVCVNSFNKCKRCEWMRVWVRARDKGKNCWKKKLFIVGNVVVWRVLAAVTNIGFLQANHRYMFISSQNAPLLYSLEYWVFLSLHRNEAHTAHWSACVHVTSIPLFYIYIF